MIRRDWREPLPSSSAEAADAIRQRIPFNATRLAELADMAFPIDPAWSGVAAWHALGEPAEAVQ